MSADQHNHYNATAREILTEARKPGNIYVGALAANDVVMVRAVKSDIIGRCENMIEEHGEDVLSGWSWSRYEDGDLGLGAPIE